jgi:SAM-dependent methyltransferase
MTKPQDQFYTGLVAALYAPLRQSVADAAIYERFVRRCGEPALEVGCGHGEPLLDLVAAGLDVTGVDSSRDMLALCKAEATRRGLQVETVCTPMESMRIDGRFRSIYLAGPTFQLVIDVDLAAQALCRFAEHLVPDGRVLVPLFTPQPIQPAFFGRWKESTDENGRAIAFQTVSQSYRAEERRVDTVLRYRLGPVDAPVEQADATWSLRWYGDGEFEALAATAGLTIDRRTDSGDAGRSYVLRLS